MSLHFILGGSGTGKSSLILERLVASALADPAKRHIMLVPEQYTMQTQRNVVRMHPDHAVMNIDILSFERLAYRVFAELGREDLHILTPMGKNMMLRQICSEHESELQVFRRSLRKPGFISRLMTILSEFYQYGITEDQLSALEPQLSAHPLLSRKLKELGIFYEALNRAKDEDTIAAEELLPVLLRLLPSSDFLKDTYIAMDCYTGYTPVQYRLLQEIFRQADHVEMAFLLPEEEWKEESREEDLFHMSQTAVNLCEAMASELGQRVTREFCRGDKRHGDRSELAFLADHFLREACEPYGSKPESITAFSCRNPREEAEAAACRIRRLVSEQGYRYRDIAVVNGDPDEYRPFLENAFRRYDIPAFMDRKRGIQGNPLVEFLQSAMDIARTDFAYESVFRFLKCGIRIMEPEEADLLENYCLSRKVSGRGRWSSEWCRRDETDTAPMEELNELRCRVLHVLEPVVETRNLFSAEGDEKVRIRVCDRTQVLRILMDNNNVGEQMAAMAAELRVDGRQQKAEEMERTEEYLRDLLDQMDDLLGSHTLSMGEFEDLWSSGLSEAKLGMIPTSLDQVSVGDVMRTRLGEIRALIVLGFNEGVIPGSPAGGGILSETERALLESNDLVLAPTAEHIANQERFYLYRLMTAPSQSIMITSSRMAADGSARRESHLWARITQIFPKLIMEEYRGSTPGQLSEYGQMWRYFADHIRGLREQEDREVLELGEYLRQKDPACMEKLIEAVFAPEKTDSIGRTAASALYGESLQGSITRLEKYAGCAYAHFLAYGLYLAKRDDGSFHYTDRGNFFHTTLEYFFRTCVEKEIDPGQINEEERRQVLKESLTAAAADGKLSVMDQSASGHYQITRWEKLADRTIEVICRMLKEEGFTPREFEMTFDGRTSASMQLQLSNEERMILRGKVDRIDVMNGQDGQFIRIVDYKTGKAEFDLNEIYQGLQMQLPMYMNAVLDRKSEQDPEIPVLPGGICYYQLDDPWVEVDVDAEEAVIEAERLKQLKMKGLILDEDEVTDQMPYTSGQKAGRTQFQWLCGHTVRKAAEFGKRILDGDVRIAPYQYKKNKGCTYCEYSAVCGFNPRRTGSEYRRIKEQKADDIWRMLEEENDGNGLDG